MMRFFDIPVFNFINHNLSNQFLDIAMSFLSRIGGGEIYFLLGVIFLFSKKRDIRMLGIVLLAGLTVSYYIAGSLKVLVARPRPFTALTNVILLGEMAKGYSFPSGHATMAFMMATLLAGKFKEYVPLYVFAALVAVSRVYMGVHYPTDVLAGALIGTVIGLLLTRIVKDLCPRSSVG